MTWADLLMITVILWFAYAIVATGLAVLLQVQLQGWQVGLLTATSSVVVGVVLAQYVHWSVAAPILFLALILGVVASVVHVRRRPATGART